MGQEEGEESTCVSRDIVLLGEHAKEGGIQKLAHGTEWVTIMASSAW